jgi:hypothetical protein
LSKKTDVFNQKIDDYITDINEVLFDRSTTLTEKVAKPFEIRYHEEFAFVHIPKDIMESSNMLFVKSLLKVIRLIPNCTMVPIEASIKFKVTEESKSFFKEMFKGLLRTPGKDEKATYNPGKSPEGRGNIHAKIIFLKNMLKPEDQKLLNHLPETCFQETKAGKVEWIHYYLNEIIADSDFNNVYEIRYRLVEILNMYAKVEKVCHTWQFLRTYKVPMSVVTNGLYKTKLVGKGNSKKSRPIKPKAPSTKVETISEEERRLLKSFEVAFEEYKQLAKQFKEDGVSLKDVDLVRSQFKDLISKKWIIVQKCSAPLTQRGSLMIKKLREENLTKEQKLTKKHRDELLALLSESKVKYDDVEQLTISSYYLLRNLIGTGEESACWKELLYGRRKLTNIKKLQTLHRSDELLALLNSNRSVFGLKTYSFEEKALKLYELDEFPPEVVVIPPKEDNNNQ